MGQTLKLFDHDPEPSQRAKTEIERAVAEYLAALPSPPVVPPQVIVVHVPERQRPAMRALISWQLIQVVLIVVVGWYAYTTVTSVTRMVMNAPANLAAGAYDSVAGGAKATADYAASWVPSWLGGSSPSLPQDKRK